MARSGRSGDSLIRFQGDSMTVYGKGEGLAAVPVTAMAEGATEPFGWELRWCARFDRDNSSLLARPGGARPCTRCTSTPRRVWRRPTPASPHRRTHFTLLPGPSMPELDMAWVFEDARLLWMTAARMLRVSRADLDAVAEGGSRPSSPAVRRGGWDAGSSEFALGVTRLPGKAGAASSTLPPTAVCWRSIRAVDDQSARPPVLIERVATAGRSRLAPGVDPRRG